MTKLIETYKKLITLQAEEILALKEVSAAHKEHIKALQALIKVQEDQLYRIKNGKPPPLSN